MVAGVASVVALVTGIVPAAALALASLALLAGVALVASRAFDEWRLHRARCVRRRRQRARRRRTEAPAETIANLSHDLRNPIAVAIGFSEMAGDEELPEEERALALAGVRRSLCEMGHLVENVLEGSALRAGRASPGGQPVDLEELCGEALAGTSVLLRSRPVALVASIEPGLTVRVDRHRLSRILGNLLGNACKYTERGEIRLQVESVGGYALVRIADTGPGIAPEALPFIFERYRRADDAGRDGAGLGLAIAHQLAVQMGGSLQAESQLGVGSTFSLTLPLADAPARRLTSAAA